MSSAAIRAMAIYMKRHVYVGFNDVDTVSPPHYRVSGRLPALAAQPGQWHHRGQSCRGKRHLCERHRGARAGQRRHQWRLDPALLRRRLRKSELGRYVYLMRAASDASGRQHGGDLRAGEFKPRTGQPGHACRRGRQAGTRSTSTWPAEGLPRRGVPPQRPASRREPGPGIYTTPTIPPRS